jgi:hypothetical protein
MGGKHDDGPTTITQNSTVVLAVDDNFMASEIADDSDIQN